jgi:hypothetical protein
MCINDRKEKVKPMGCPHPWRVFSPRLFNGRRGYKFSRGQHGQVSAVRGDISGPRGLLFSDLWRAH